MTEVNMMPRGGSGAVGGYSLPSKAREPKDARFRRLANRRVPKAIKAIGFVRNLAARTNYVYTPEQAARICDVLDAAVQQLRLAFESPGDTQSSFIL